MKVKVAKSILVACALVTLRAQAQMVFNVNFEAPSYSLGTLNGKDSWAAPSGYHYVTTTHAHSGSQSMSSQLDGSGASRLPEAGAFNPVAGSGWWLETWAYIPTSAYHTQSLFKMGGEVVYSPYIQIDGDGKAHFGSWGPEAIMELGSSVLDKWVKLRMEQTGPQGNSLRLSITGEGINKVVDSTYGTSYNPGKVSLAVMTKTPYNGIASPGIAYWDDMRAGYGAVPEPTSMAVVGLVGLGYVVARRRRA